MLSSSSTTRTRMAPAGSMGHARGAVNTGHRYADAGNAFGMMVTSARRLQQTVLPVMACRVLVVEDDLSVLYFVTETLRDEGYDVVTAPDGQVGLACVQEQPPDVVLLDYQLPTLDGPQFVVAYRRLHHAPIVLMTAAMRAQERCAEVQAE